MDTPRRTVTEGQAVRASWINIPLGICLIIAPFVLNYASHPTAQGNDIVLGILLAWSNASVRPAA
jgi:hypothetical protein